jgi:hypothetical protein
MSFDPLALLSSDFFFFFFLPLATF